MQELKSEILSLFLDRLAEAMNDSESCYDIPFLVSVLHQKMVRDTILFSEFVRDLGNWSDYVINLSNVTEEQYIKVTVELSKLEEFTDYYDSPKFNYELRLSYDERDWGYCQCKPENHGYRIDKHCCGDGCDWNAPKFTLHKIYDVMSHSWDGMERDYWKFEDEYNRKAKTKNENDLLEEINRVADVYYKLLADCKSEMYALKQKVGELN